MHHILLAIDDATLRESASDYLNRQGCFTFTAESREAARNVLQEEGADCLVVEAAGGAEDTLCVCSAVRGVSGIPIIVLSFRDDSEERARGLEAGIDDYLVVPFNPRELMARIKVVSRRAAFAPVNRMEPCGYRFGEWRLDALSRTLHHSDGSVKILTASDFRLLETLVMHAHEILPRSHLLQVLHGREWYRYEHSIEARMSRMRRLLRGNCGSRSGTLIRSVRRAGYLFESRVETNYSLLPPGRDASWLVR